MQGIRNAEKRAYQYIREFREHRAMQQMGSAAILQRSRIDIFI